MVVTWDSQISVEKPSRTPSIFTVEGSDKGGSSISSTGKPADVVVKKKKISTTYALINLLKGMVGPGCFALPQAFEQAGLWTGFALVFILGIVSSICMIKLVECSQYLCKRNNKPSLDYGEMAEEAIKSSFPWIRRYWMVGKVIVNICLIMMQMGILCVYYIFIVDHAQEIVNVIWKDNGLSRWVFIGFTFPALMLIISIRTIRVTSYICLLGNFLITYCIVVLLQELVRNQGYSTGALPWITTVNGVTQAAGSILYALEGQALVLPLENKMKHPEDMKGYNGVLVTGVNLVSLIYAACGFYGYLAYGPNVKPSVTLNLTNQPLDFSVKCMLLLTVYLSYLIQSFPVVEIIWTPLKAKLKKRGSTRFTWILAEYGFRYCIVLVSFGVAVAIPNLDQVISIVGVTAGMMLALILPPLIETICQLPNWLQDLPRWKIGVKMAFNVFYFILGLVFLITGLQANIQAVIKS